MKTVNEDTYHFYEEGGWGFLYNDGDDSAEDESSEGSVFEEDSDALDDGSEGSSDSDGSDFDEDDSGSDGSGSGDDESEGEDWDELERKAKRGELG
jgi:nucleosome binding factor SPN SPT16 subunit